MPTGLPIPKTAKTGDAAATGHLGTALNDLISKAEKASVETLYGILKTALTRVLASGAAVALTSPHIFNGDELAKLTSTTAAIVATGSLYGHYQIRRKAEAVERLGGIDFFADIPGPVFGYDPTEFPLLQPYDAIEYFKSLIPRLGVDPIQWAPLMQRTAFTLAAATEVTIVDKVQKLILDKLRTGEGISTGPAEIEELLDSFGVTPKNPQYAQMVQRTNMMDAYTTGYQMEMEHPEVKEFFPAWLYMGIRDGRQGEDHEIRFGKYYPNSLPFAIVRGKRVWNCRCIPNAIDKYKWARLVKGGAVFSTI